MPIELTSNLTPRNGGNFFLMEDIYVKGGWRTVETVSDMMAIPVDGLKTGCVIYVIQTGKHHEAIVDEAQMSATFPELNLGGSSLNMMGSWDAATAYSRNDAVTFDGSSYVQIAEGPISNVTPPDPTTWMLLAERGRDGEQGPHQFFAQF